MDVSSYFEGKKVTLMGLGLLGRGVGDARFLAGAGADLIVTDLKSAEELAPSLEALKEFPNIRYSLGEHKREDFEGRDLVLIAPKTPSDSPYIKAAQESGAHVTMSAALFATIAQIPVVGVTGTRGKTTTTQMIAHILKRAGKNVLLGGNIQGVSTLALLPEVTPNSIAVLELDSWQLQGFGREKISPNVAVFTTFYPDHMDYYQGDMDAYLKDKAEIFLHQKEGDSLVLGKQASELIMRKYPSLPVSPVVVHEYDGKLQIPGKHNRENAACAQEAALALGISEEVSREALASFKGVAGRLEFLREVNGVKIYNDTTSTTPEATIAALRALDDGKKNIVLIMGGYDKKLDMTALVPEIQKSTKRVLLLSGSGTTSILPLLEGASVYDSLTATLEEAVRFATTGDIILFSPAFASFGMFKNEYDRGEQFATLVSKLT